MDGDQEGCSWRGQHTLQLSQALSCGMGMWVFWVFWVWVWVWGCVGVMRWCSSMLHGTPVLLCVLWQRGRAHALLLLLTQWALLDPCWRSPLCPLTPYIRAAWSHLCISVPLHHSHLMCACLQPAMVWEKEHSEHSFEYTGDGGAHKVRGAAALSPLMRPCTPHDEQSHMSAPHHHAPPMAAGAQCVCEHRATPAHNVRWRHTHPGTWQPPGPPHTFTHVLTHGASHTATHTSRRCITPPPVQSRCGWRQRQRRVWASLSGSWARCVGARGGQGLRRCCLCVPYASSLELRLMSPLVLGLTTPQRQ